jgi:hypothetical protein
VLHKIAVAGSWLHVIWIVSVIGMLFVLVFGSETLRRRAVDVYFVRTVGLLAVALVVIGVAGLLKITAWWLKT